VQKISLGLSLAFALVTSAGAEPSTAEQFRPYYPPEALAAGLNGEATLRCNMSPALVLEKCRLVSETPAKAGFGAAALRLAALSQPNPHAAFPPERNRIMTFRFTASPLGITPDTLKPLVVVKNPDWVRLPTPEESSRVFPSTATADQGRAVVQCHVAVDQTMADCRVVAETPEGQGFGPAALELTKVFRMTPKTYDDVPVAGHPVIVPIVFQRPPPAKSRD
jgi:hypothetical protein